MIEFFGNIFGLCGEHFHPNVWTVMILHTNYITTVHYIKCKCGGWFRHKKNCENNLDNSE